jgi:class 3 adenylate cyclase
VHDEDLTARVGELRRLTIMFCDLVGSTELSGRHEPETYRQHVRTYRAACRDVIEARFEGHIVQFKGDGTLAAFGFPVAHENDTERAVRAGLALVRAVRDLRPPTGERLDVRVGVHHGPVYIDLDDEDIDGWAANVGARLQSLAEPGTVVVSDEVRRLVSDRFEIVAGEPASVKGVPEPLQPFRVVGDRRAPVAPSWSTPLVERDAELERLRRAWAEVAERDTGLLVHADAGVGKSRLVGAFVDEAERAGARVAHLPGSPFHADAGFHPVRALIEARCHIGDDADGPERLRRLAADVAGLGLDTVPLLAPVLGIDPSAGYEQAPAEGRRLEEQVAAAVREYVLACIGGHGIVVAEDLHWYDDATRALLGELVRAGGVLVVATSRNRERGAWETVELRPLSPAGRLALIDAIDGRLSGSERLALAERSDGIPLYLEELVRVGPTDQRATPADRAPVPGSVPEALYEPLVARLYATPAALPVAAAAAAAGQSANRALIAETMAVAEPELDAALGALVDTGVLEPVNGVSYRFRHELLREVAYELQPPSWRRRAHDRLCDLLVRDGTSDSHVLASHFERAERYVEAAAAHQETAEWARRRGHLDEARAHLSRAIELVEGLPQDAARDHREVELRLRRGFLAMSTEGAASAEASADFDRCLERAGADPHGDDMFSTLISLWPHYLSRAELDRARAVTAKLRDALDGRRELFRPHNRGGFGILDWFSGDFAGAAEELSFVDDVSAAGLEEVVAAVWFVPNDPTASMLVHLALARFMVGDAAGADERLAAARALAAPLDFPQGPWSVAYADWLGSWMWMEARRFDRAETAVAALREASARHGFDSWELIAATHGEALEALSALHGGGADDPAARAEAIAAHVDVWQLVGLRVFLPFYLTTIGALLAAAGDADGARERYAESLALAAETGMRFYDAETARLRAALEPDPQARAGALHDALELARSQAARPFELRIEHDLQAR